MKVSDTSSENITENRLFSAQFTEGAIMAKLNVKSRTTRFTYNGAPAVIQTAEQELRRSVMACLLWEDSCYEDGESVADRIKKLVPRVKPEAVAEITFSARDDMKLRHMPLFLTREMVRHPEHKKYVSDLLFQVIQRPDELSEFMALYWKDGKTPIAAQVKKGLARAFTKFSEYELAKYNRDSQIKLRDVLFMVHAKPEDRAQRALFKKLVDNTLETPDTWEVSLSAGKDKGKEFTRLLKEKKLGGLALLRNLRNMNEGGVSKDLIRSAITEMRTDKILPFRFLSAAKHAPEYEAELEIAMFSCLKNTEKLDGRTAIVIDVSGSMDTAISSKSDLTRLEAACALAVLLREIASVDIYTFSENVALVPPRRGFALSEAIQRSQPHNGTYLGRAIDVIPKKTYDRIVVITDEQSSDTVGAPPAKNAYMINVASYQNGVGYGDWTRVTGWSEHIVRYISHLES